MIDNSDRISNFIVGTFSLSILLAVIGRWMEMPNLIDIASYLFYFNFAAGVFVGIILPIISGE